MVLPFEPISILDSPNKATTPYPIGIDPVELSLFPYRCTACMICVMACSFHHGRRFDRKLSSIEVNIRNKERETQVHIHREAGGKRQACDACRGEEEPLCARYCAPRAILIQRSRE